MKFLYNFFLLLLLNIKMYSHDIKDVLYFMKTLKTSTLSETNKKSMLDLFHSLSILLHLVGT